MRSSFLGENCLRALIRTKCLAFCWKSGKKNLPDSLRPFVTFFDEVEVAEFEVKNDDVVNIIFTYKKHAGVLYVSLKPYSQVQIKNNLDPHSKNILNHFFSRFGIISEDFPSNFGQFVLPTTPFAESEIDIPPGWQSAFVLYQSMNRDKLLIDSSGKLAWYVRSEERIIPIVQDVVWILNNFAKSQSEDIAFDYWWYDEYKSRRKK